MALRKTARKVVVYGLLLSCCLAFCAPAPINRLVLAREDGPVQGEEAPPLVVELSLPKQDYRPLEPIVATVTITNTSEQTIYLQTHVESYTNLDFLAHDLGPTIPQPARRTAYHYERVERIPGWNIKENVHLDPGQFQREDFVVNLVSDLTAPGPYSIAVAVPNWSSSNRDPKVQRVIRSAPLKVKVAGKILESSKQEVRLGYTRK